jgi:hypothetical protein
MRLPLRTVALTLLFLTILTVTPCSSEEVVSGTLHVEVVYDADGGPQRFLTDLEDALVKELAYLGCYEKVVAEQNDSGELILFRATLRAPLEETESTLSIHETIRSREETGENTSSHIARLDSILELFPPGGKEPVASRKMNKRAHYSSQFQWEDGGLQARVELMEKYVMSATSWVCKQGRKKLKNLPD